MGYRYEQAQQTRIQGLWYTRMLNEKDDASDAARRTHTPKNGQRL